MKLMITKKNKKPFSMSCMKGKYYVLLTFIVSSLLSMVIHRATMRVFHFSQNIPVEGYWGRIILKHLYLND